MVAMLLHLKGSKIQELESFVLIWIRPKRGSMDNWTFHLENA